MENKKHYLTNAKLRQELILSKQQKAPTNNLAKCWYLIAKKLSVKYQASSAFHKQEDFISDAILKCMNCWHTCNENKNVFAWFTSVILNEMKTSYKKELKSKVETIDIEEVYDLFFEEEEEVKSLYEI